MDNNLDSWLNDEYNYIIDNFNSEDLLLEKDLDLNNTSTKFDVRGNSCNMTIFWIPSININNKVIQIKLNKSENLNKFLNFKIYISVSNISKIGSTIRTLTLLADKLFGLKITKNDKYFIIPMIILSKIQHDNKTIEIRIFNNNFQKNKYDFKLFLNSNKKSLNDSINIAIDSCTYVIKNCIQYDIIELNKYSLGLIIWHRFEDNNINFLEPVILKIEISFYNNNIKISKDINIEKIKFDDKNGYFISTNKLNFNQIINYYKSFDSDIYNNLITWDNNIIYYMEIQWSNYYDNTFCVIENIFLIK
jgi:hypothetical protein